MISIKSTFVNFNHIFQSKKKIKSDPKEINLFSKINNNITNNTKLTMLYEQLIQGLKSWEYNPFVQTEQEIIYKFQSMFLYYDLYNELNINVDRLYEFLIMVKDSYHKNPYHNLIHAFDVTQTLFCYLANMKMDQYFSKFEIFVLLISSLSHDLSHPGVSNNFLIQTSNELAKQYNQISVLENHHISTMYKLLHKSKVISHFTPKQKKLFKYLSSNAIFATDLCNHNSIVERLQSKLNSDQCNIWSSLADKSLLIDVLVHTCDISNVAKPFQVSKEWTMLISNEFIQQAHMEKKIGIPLSYNFDDHDSTNSEEILKKSAVNSVNFINTFCEPLLQLISRAFPETTPVLDYIEINKLNWYEIIE
ncbi:cAMP phosphodiesterase [Tieghemostelium lacteum]|uniref:cAMP phosphodiesterase n=1 Tax=Tieghemostelium lacteum TaxID=361077 RepID=A0A152A0Z1_TIELA|nr:cAMP phosphodiesterase [Tieghemostelium lacteum]|eukprot:KYQ99921.1 cAMP phosphodiesterase [Tieghemostelium lacteum]